MLWATDASIPEKMCRVTVNVHEVTQDKQVGFDEIYSLTLKYHLIVMLHLASSAMRQYVWGTTNAQSVVLF